MSAMPAAAARAVVQSLPSRVVAPLSGLRGWLAPIRAGATPVTAVSTAALQQPAGVTTDRTGYLFSEAVKIAGHGFTPGDAVTLRVTHAGGGAEEAMGHDPFVAAADENGTFSAEWSINREDVSGHDFVLTALGATSGAAGDVAFSRIATVGTDKSDYQPGETAVISGAGFGPGEWVKLRVTHADHTAEGGAGHEPWDVAADVDGRFSATWFVHPDDSRGSIFRLTVSGADSGLTATAMFTDAFFTVVDSGGANDVPSQNDLTRMGRDDSDPDVLKLFWSWDSTDDWTGTGQTGDACALFDSDGDGNINQAICVRINNPGGNAALVNQVVGSPFVWTCTDERSDRCTNPSGPNSFTPAQLQAGAFGTLAPSPPANLITNTDPFANLDSTQNWPNDSTIQVNVQKSYLQSGATLVNVCSYPSAGNGGNNNPFDCIVTPGGGFLQITKAAPDGTTQVFNFTVNPGAISKSITGAGTTGSFAVAIGTAYSVTETVPAGWQLDSAACALESGSATGTRSGNTVSGITVQSGKVTSCTFTDSRTTGSLTINKTVDDPDGSGFTSGSFVVNAACTNPAINYSRTIAYPTPGGVTISGIVSGSSCTVTETSKPTAPAGYEWATETISGSPATITTGGTANVTVANKLNLLAPKVNEGVAKTNDADHNGTFNDAETVPGTATYPYTVTYRLAITNSGGPGTISSIIDDKTTVSSATSTQSPTCASLIGASIGAGATLTCYYDVTFANADAQVVNTATVTVTNAAAPNGVTGSDTSTVNFTPKPALTLTKSATPSTYDAVNQVISYSYTLKNTGNVTLSGTFSVTDDKIVAPNTVSCTQPADGKLSPQEAMTCTASYTITQDDLNAGSVTNKATGSNGTTTSNEATATVTATETGNLTLAKSASPTTYSAVGQVITYTYTITNGTNRTQAGPFSISDDKQGTIAPCGSGPLAPGASTSCTATHAITQADLDNGSIVNTATATDGTRTSAPATATVTAVQRRELTLTKSAAPTTYAAVGQVIAYSYLVTNSGNVTITGPFTVSDDRSTDESCPPTPALAPGASVTCTATYTITAADLVAGSVTNTATAQGFVNTTTVTSNPDSETVRALAASLTIVKTADAPSTPAGTDIGFTITVSNGGPAMAVGVSLNDVLPSGGGLVWVENPDNTACTLASNALTCAFGNLAGGGSVTVHVSSPTGPNSCGTYNNTATAQAGNHGPVSSSASTTVECGTGKMTGGGRVVPDTGGLSSFGFNARGTVGAEANGHFNYINHTTRAHINGRVTAVLMVNETTQTMKFRVTTSDLCVYDVTTHDEREPGTTGDTLTVALSSGTACPATQITGAPVLRHGNIQWHKAGANQAPAAAADAASTTGTAPARIAVLGNDVAGPAEESGQLLSVTGVGAADNGTTALNGDNTITYTPGAGFVGVDSFTYTVCDNGTTNGAADPQCTAALVTVTVEAANRPPSAGPIAWNTPVDQLRAGTAATASSTAADPDGNLSTGTWIWGDGSSPSPATISGGTATGTHTYAAAGFYTVTLTVTDSAGLTAQSHSTVTVSNPAAGYLTGAGFINSPASSLTAKPTLGGTATITQLSARHAADGTMGLSTNTFKLSYSTGSFTFNSTSMQWMVVSGNTVWLKGEGWSTVNGVTEAASFLVAGFDVATGYDKARVKIQSKATGQVIYDNQKNANGSSPADSTLAAVTTTSASTLTIRR
jgi:uncharacterized repeat protein (TIGR01451 family)